jgi:uncharacterized integral membrane protein
MAKGRGPYRLRRTITSRVLSCIAEVEHQVRLLRSVFWWYLLPFLIAFSVAYSHASWTLRHLPWTHQVPGILSFAGAILVFGLIYWLNRYAVRRYLLPRQAELRELLENLLENEGSPEAAPPVSTFEKSKEI